MYELKMKPNGTEKTMKALIGYAYALKGKHLDGRMI